MNCVVGSLCRLVSSQQRIGLLKAADNLFKKVKPIYLNRKDTQQPAGYEKFTKLKLETIRYYSIAFVQRH